MCMRACLCLHLIISQPTRRVSKCRPGSAWGRVPRVHMVRRAASRAAWRRRIASGCCSRASRHRIMDVVSCCRPTREDRRTPIGRSNGRTRARARASMARLFARLHTDVAATVQVCTALSSRLLRPSQGPSPRCSLGAAWPSPLGGGQHWHPWDPLRGPLLAQALCQVRGWARGCSVQPGHLVRVHTCVRARPSFAAHTPSFARRAGPSDGTPNTAPGTAGAGAGARAAAAARARVRACAGRRATRAGLAPRRPPPGRRVAGGRQRACAGPLAPASGARPAPRAHTFARRAGPADGNLSNTNAAPGAAGAWAGARAGLDHLRAACGQ